MEHSLNSMSATVNSAAREAERARAALAADLASVSEDGRKALSKALREAKPALVAAGILTGAGLALLVRAAAQPRRMRLRWVSEASLGQKFARALAGSLATALVRLVVRRAIAALPAAPPAPASAPQRGES